MSKFASSVARWLVCTVLLLCALVLPARAMNARDILHLNTLGEGISQLSWCTPDSLSFVKRSRRPAQDGTSGQPPERLTVLGSDLVVHLLSNLTTTAPKMERVATYRDADVQATCLRRGEFIYADGTFHVQRTGTVVSVPVSFAHLVSTSPIRSMLAVNFTLEGTAFNGQRPSTADDGSVFGALLSTPPIDIGSIEAAKREEFRAYDRSYSLRSGEITVSFFATRPGGRSQPFPIYGLAASENQNVGSYKCVPSRPGCPAQASWFPPSAYYIYSKYNTKTARVDALFTIMPKQTPIQRRWPIVAKPGVVWDGLEIQGVVLDESRCFVLLQPIAELAANRVNGRVRRDLLLAECSFTKGKLEFDAPRGVAQKQGSFIHPKLSLHGSFVVIAEDIDFSGIPEDQIEAEREASQRVKRCVHIFNADAQLAHVNTFCASERTSKGLVVSPDAAFVAIESDTDPVIVGRDYRNVGSGPAWLTHGGQP